MICRVGDLRYKDVINIKNGCRLGYVCDIELDTCGARVCAIVIYGKSRFFGLLGREEDTVISWCDIDIIGEDIILVNIESAARRRKNRGLWESLAK